MAKFVILKRAGEPGKVAVNADLVTEVRSSSGPFIDIHFGEHRVAVEGSLHQVVALLGGREESGEPTRQPAADFWLTTPASGR